MPHSPSARLALVALLLAAPALAAPPPALRAALPARALPALGARAAAPARGLAAACGTNLEAVADAIRSHVARTDITVLPTSHSIDRDGIAVLEDDGTFVFANLGGAPVVDVAAVSAAYYRSHDDDVDFLAIYLASGMSQWLGSPGAFAAAWPLRNDTQGLGLASFDVGAAFGSAARLQLVCTMNALSRYPADPDAPIGGPGDTFSTMDVLAHEIAHRWLAYTFVDSAGTVSPALLGRDYQHWNFFFDADSSFMEGCDWARVAPDSFVTDGVSSTYGALDQYLMGMRTRAEIDSFFVVNDPTDFDPPGTYVPQSVPWVGIGCHGRATWWKLADIEAVHGARVPDGSVAPRNFRVGFVLVVPNGSAASDSDLAKLQVIRARFPGTFAAATWMRGTIDESMRSRAGSVRIAHVPLADVEDAGTPRTIAARVTIAGGGLPLAVDPAGVVLHWRAGTSGAFADVPLAPVAPDSFAVTAVAPVSAGVVQYWLSATSDSAGIGASLPAAGAAAPFRFTVGPDLVPPVIVHVPVAAQSPDRLPQTLLARVDDNVGVDSVWCEWSIDGGAVTTQPAAFAGGDSFTVALGAGLVRGQRLAYRFRARDAAAAGNLAGLAAAFDTLVVTRDTFDDFENPAPWTHGFYRWNHRDAWHLEHDSTSAGGGTAWHCGSDDGTPYAPYLDGVLDSPWYVDVTAGTTLAFEERHQLEQEADGLAFDGARVEVQQPGGDFVPVEPTPGYTHAMDEKLQPFAVGDRCWSGDSHGWVTRALDLSAFAPGPVRVRFRMCSDELLGEDGLWIDHVRLLHAGDPASVGAAPLAFAIGRAGPNPARRTLALSLTLPRASAVEWTLLDVQGRRIATLWSGPRAAGRGTLDAALPGALAPGLYFTRLAIDGRVRDAQRVAIVR